MRLAGEGQLQLDAAAAPPQGRSQVAHCRIPLRSWVPLAGHATVKRKPAVRGPGNRSPRTSAVTIVPPAETEIS